MHTAEKMASLFLFTGGGFEAGAGFFFDFLSFVFCGSAGLGTQSISPENSAGRASDRITESIYPPKVYI